MPLDPSVTVLVTRTVREGREADYEAWVEGVAAVARRFPGHRGLNLVRPRDASRTYTLVFRFDSSTQLDAWESSPERHAWVARALDLVSYDPPVELPALDVVATWHARLDAHPMHTWVRSALFAAVV